MSDSQSGSYANPKHVLFVIGLLVSAALLLWYVGDHEHSASNHRRIIVFTHTACQALKTSHLPIEYHENGCSMYAHVKYGHVSGTYDVSFHSQGKQKNMVVPREWMISIYDK